MYPYTLFWNITLYDIMMTVGIVTAFLVFLLYAKRVGLPEKIITLVLISAFIAVVVGLLSAILFQSIYFYIETGVFEWRGLTFYGGLVGGAAGFLVTYYVAGYFFYRKSETPRLPVELSMKVFGIVICTVAVAHMIGRIGCLTAGCCHGKLYPEKKWFTLPVLHLSAEDELIYTEYATPVPLYEAFFLLDLFILLSWRALSGKEDGLPLYMILYGAWRFGIEFFRGDDRGETVLKFLSPSQLTAILMILGGAALYVVYLKIIKKKQNAGNS